MLSSDIAHTPRVGAAYLSSLKDAARTASGRTVRRTAFAIRLSRTASFPEKRAYSFVKCAAKRSLRPVHHSLKRFGLRRMARAKKRDQQADRALYCVRSCAEGGRLRGKP